ncbi:MAG: type I pantothenate kinase [Caulobacteraceae bacterium]|nr:type I pantothenate kinase [Caulobacteraceae bacterium]
MTRLAEVADLLRGRRPGAGPFVVGVTGGVAAGKSAFASELASALAAWPERPAVEVVGTDGFLFDNATLKARQLTQRKGFPESYDREALRAALAAIRVGPTEFPGYSHAIYDLDPALVRRLDPPDVLIIEGLGLHEPPATTGLDALVYLDAPEALLQAWYAERFIAFWRAAADDPTSFYVRFRHLDEAQTREAAAMVWEATNLPNLRDHIVRARDHAHVIVRKGEGHAIEAVIAPDR